MNSQQLNAVYRPLHRKGRGLLKAVSSLGYGAQLRYCNLHERLENGKCQVMYFPLPEIEITGMALNADLGVCLDHSAWLEVTLTKQDALTLDYVTLAQHGRLTVYGAAHYREDLLNEHMEPAGTIQRIAQTREEKVCLHFAIESADTQSMQTLVKTLVQQKVIHPSTNT